MRIRKLLLVHPNRSTRGLIKKYILSELNDTEIYDALSGQDGLKQFSAINFDVIIASDQLKDLSVTEFRTGLDAARPNGPSPLVLISESESKNVRNELVALGFDRVAQLRIRPTDLIRMINAVCDPRTWRKDTRYHIPNVGVNISTLQNTMEATLINISMGGLFVELIARQPAELLKGRCTITLKIPLPKIPVIINGLTSKLLRLEVVDWCTDLTPATLRATFIFSDLEKRPRNKLTELIQMAGQDKLSAIPVTD
jgi:DNA-binding NarL/FixJ family response regulator